MSAAPSPHVPRPTRRAVLTGVLATTVVAGTLSAPAASASTPVLGKATPAAVAAGHGITLPGTALTGTTAVFFRGGDGPGDDLPAASFQVLSDKSLVAQVPLGAATGPVEVTTPAGSGTTLLPVAILRPPVIDALSSGVGAGGDAIEIDGSDLGVKRRITIAGRPAPIKVTTPPASATTVTVTVPPGLPGGPTELVVAAEGGTVSTPFYIAPTIRTVAPITGSTVGGGTVVISGTGLSGAESVTFGGVPAPSVVPVSDREVVVRAPAGAPGPAPVVVRTRTAGRSAEGAAPTPYTYQTLPSVTALSRAFEAVTADTGAARPLTITGNNLSADTQVTFGPTPVTPAVDPVTGRLTFTPPTSPTAKVVPITLTNTQGTLTHKATTSYAYVAPPTVARLAPATGPAGTTVVISGTGFVPGTTAAFGSTAASCTLVNPTSLRCTAPQGTGSAPVSVTTPLGTAPLETAPAVPFAYTTAPLVAPPAPVVPRPAVRSLTPSVGLTGSAVGLLGTNLDLVRAVRFPAAGGGTVDGTNLLTVSATRVVVRVPAGALSGALQLVAADGSVVGTDAVRYTAVVPPSIASIDGVGDATLGVVGGDTVVVRGAGLMAGTAPSTVTVGGVRATVLSSPAPTASTLAIRVPPSAGRRAPVVVTTPFGSATSQLSLYYVPQVRGTKPVVLPAGRTGVMISGNGFTGAHAVTEGGRLAAVTFGGVPAEEVVVLSDKQVLAVPASGTQLADGMLVTTQHGGWNGTSQWVTTPLSLPIPGIVSLSPSFAVLGDTPPRVTISGDDLTDDTVVRFGTSNATVISAARDGRSMVVQAPERLTAGSVNVTVSKTLFGEVHTSTLSDGFRYQPFPSITDVSPSTGQTGTTPPTATITGRNLRLNTVVRFGDAPATVNSAANDGSSIVVSPPLSNASGPVTVSVTNIVDGEPLTATRANAYSYSLSAATVTAMSATTGAPGNTVTITGTSFVQVSAVRFGTVGVPFTVVNPTTIFVTVPATPSGQTGSVPVTVVNGTGTPSSSSSEWTWDTRAAVTGLSASTGPSGTRITITGSGFLGVVTQVRFGSVLGLTPTVVNDTTITVTVPNTPPIGGIAEISVGSGTTFSPDNPSSANDWTWAPIAAITGMSTKSAAPGTTVTVTGRHFTGTTSVSIHNTPITTGNFTVAPDGLSLTFVVPAKPTSGNTVDRAVRIVNGSGVSNTVDTAGVDLFTWP